MQNAVQAPADKPGHWRSLATAAASVACVIAIFCGILMWTSSQVDGRARARDSSLVDLVLAQAIQRVARAQESSTVWDDAVRRLGARPLDQDWADINIGTWFSSYAGHDEVYILAPDGSPLYAMRNGKRAQPSTVTDVDAVVRPLVARFRTLGDMPQGADGSLPMLSPGLADLALVHGHPAIVSVKPVVSDSGRIPQARGSEAVHISVVYLDTKFMQQLGAQYGLVGARYTREPSAAKATVSLPLRASDRRLLGYVTWRPFAPGRDVVATVLPLLLIALVAGGLVIVVLMQRLNRRTSDLEESRAHAQHLACHDTLTGLPNRSMFEMRLDAALARAARDGARVALLTLDLDRFKAVNDTHGHPVGDMLLKAVAQRIGGELRAGDTVARIAGDEFAIVLECDDTSDAVEAVCRRLVEQLARPFALAGLEIHIGASIGVGMAPQQADVRMELARKSDVALYEAKHDGRNRFVFFSDEMDRSISLRDSTERDLRAALVNRSDQLRLLYQPVFSSATGMITAVEALLRWNRPGHGLVSPLNFIPIAEQTGLITELGDWVMETALRDAREWPHLRISVNVSVLQLRAPDFVPRLLAMLEREGVRPDRLQLELTETALMDPNSNIAAKLVELRAAGILIALDDFGTGYSSLSYIRDLSVDRIKIDRSFVATIDSSNGSLVEALVTLAHANGLEVVAEGVETVAQEAFLARVGCEELQGFLLARPLPAARVARLGPDARAKIEFPCDRAA